MMKKVKKKPGLSLKVHVGETVLIADNCGVSVTSVDGSKVQLSLDFPRDMPVDRPDRREIRRITNEHIPGIAIFQKG